MMASNVALKRAKRAQQRKQAVAVKRRLELVESALGPRARRAAQSPLRLCVLQGEVVDGAVAGGIASVLLARGRSQESVTAAIFLVDTYCLGIKDVIFRDFDADELAFVVKGMSANTPLTVVEPAYARKLLHQAAAWGTSIGFRPHRDFAAAEQIFGDVSADACDAAFSFGHDGKPFYVPGPTETRAQVRQRFAHLIARFGPDGFDYITEL
jgi:hypothetical protein